MDWKHLLISKNTWCQQQGYGVSHLFKASSERNNFNFSAAVKKLHLKLCSWCGSLDLGFIRKTKINVMKLGAELPCHSVEWILAIKSFKQKPWLTFSILSGGWQTDQTGCILKTLFVPILLRTFLTSIIPNCVYWELLFLMRDKCFCPVSLPNQEKVSVCWFELNWIWKQMYYLIFFLQILFSCGFLHRFCVERLVNACD